MKTHTVEGERMLAQVGGLLADVGLVVRASHERWDGGGYPDGLAGEAIPLAACIVSACDAFNAMTTDRSYRKALPLSVAVAELQQEQRHAVLPGRRGRARRARARGRGRPGGRGAGLAARRGSRGRSRRSCGAPGAPPGLGPQSRKAAPGGAAARGRGAGAPWGQRRLIGMC